MWTIAPDASLLDKLFFGAKVSLFGMGTVFAILFLLYGSLILSRAIFSKKEVTTNIEAKNPARIEPIKETVTLKSRDEELIAVIAAAISASTGRPISSFKVVSFKRK